MRSSPLIFLPFSAIFVLAACQHAPDKAENRTTPFIATAPNYVSVAASAPQQFAEKTTTEVDRVALYEAAVAEMKKSNYEQATTLWKLYTARFTGRASYEQAQVHLSESLFRTGNTDEALPVLQPVLESPSEKGVFAEGRLLYAEMLISKKRLDEAVATTFDVMPDPKAEAAFGIRRVAKREKITPAQEIKVMTLRGRVFAELNKQEESVVALASARKRLKNFKGIEKNSLTAHVAWRQIETLSALCRNRIKPPLELSEADFLDYSNEFYSCAEPSRVFFCEVVRGHDEQIGRLALGSYRDLVLKPLALRDPLPPPSRKVKPSQIPFYETELKQFIEKTVETHAKRFKNLEKCNVFDLF